MDGEQSPDQAAIVADVHEIADSTPIVISSLESNRPVEDQLGPVEKDMLRSRRVMAYSLVAIFAITISVGGASCFSSDRVEAHFEKLLPLILPAETGLLGSVVGFYFGSISSSKSG